MSRAAMRKAGVNKRYRMLLRYNPRDVASLTGANWAMENGVLRHTAGAGVAAYYDCGLAVSDIEAGKYRLKWYVSDLEQSHYSLFVFEKYIADHTTVDSEKVVDVTISAGDPVSGKSGIKPFTTESTLKIHYFQMLRLED